MKLLAVFLAAIALTTQAQNSQFIYDASGNLLVRKDFEAGVAPQIFTHPVPQIVQPGEIGTFFVVAVDSRGLSYQWRFNETNISGETNDALLLTNVTVAKEGFYSVVLANSSGSVTSAPAALMIDSDGDDLADSWEATYFTNLSQTALGDHDGDGVSNGDEFRDGTNPTDSVSASFRLSVSSDGGSITLSPAKLKYTNGEVVTVTAVPSGQETFHGWTGDITTRSNSISLIMASDKTVFAHFSPLNLSWINAAGGDWHVPSNWSLNLVPDSSDNAFITMAVTVTNNSSAECGSLTLGTTSVSTSVTGSGTLTIHRSGVWFNGSMRGPGRTIIESNATFTINNTSTVFLERTLENAGTILWTGADSANLQCGGAVITNRPGAVFEVQNNASFYPFPGNGRFDNAGILRKAAGTGITRFDVNNNFATVFPFNNYGTTEVQTGTLLCSATFVNDGAVNVSSGATMRIAAGGSGSGTFMNLAGALVDWTAGTFTAGPGTLLGGSGIYKVSGGTVTLNVDLEVQNLDLSAALNGSGALTVNNVLNWTAGSMNGSGRTIIAPGATNYINNVSGTVFLNTRTLENAGTIIWTGADSFNLQASGAVITNRAGALFEVRNNASFYPFPASSRFDNAGTLRKSAGSGTTTFDFNNSFATFFPFNNYGTTEIQTGTLRCSSVCVNSGAVTLSSGTTLRMSAGGSASGTFTNPATALVEWTGGTFTLGPGSLLSGSGLYKVNSGSLTLNTDLSVQNLDLLATLDGSGRLTVNNVLNWTAGTMGGSGRTIIATGATSYIANATAVFLNTRTLENAGTILWTGADSANLQCSGAVITNRAGALFEVRNNASFYPFPASSRFDNAGTLRKTMGTGTTRFDVNNSFGTFFPFNNYGTLEIESGICLATSGYTCTSSSLLHCVFGNPSTYGRLQVNGAVTLNGALRVSLTNGFVPASNDTFTVMNAGSRNGTFASFSYPSNRISIQLSNTPTAVVLTVTNVLPVPEPVLLMPLISGSNLFLTWTATPDATYRLEQKTDLNSTNWVAIPGDVTTSSNLAGKLDVLTSSNRFYRVQVLP